MTILRFDYQLFLLKESLYDYIGLLSSIFINISLVIWQMLSKTRWKICPMEKMALCSKTNCFQNLSVIEKCVQWSFSFDTIKLSKKKQTFYHVLQKKTAFCCYFEKQQFHSRQSNVGVNLSIIFLAHFISWLAINKIERSRFYGLPCIVFVYIFQLCFISSTWNLYNFYNEIWLQNDTYVKNILYWNILLL